MREQIIYILAAIILIPFIPFLAWQGKRLRKSIPKLPEAKGPYKGSIKGHPAQLNVLGLGESTFAGVGIESQRDGITYHIAKTLHQNTGNEVRWEVLARSGYTARDVHEKLVPELPETPLDFIIIGLGGNETFNLNRPLRWRRQLKALITELAAKQPDSKIIIANMPAVGHFPAFPKSFQLILGGLVNLHRQVIIDLPLQFSNTYYMSEKVSWQKWKKHLEDGQTINDFYSDGVHPSAITYKIWGEQIGEWILGLPDLQSSEIGATT